MPPVTFDFGDTPRTVSEDDALEISRRLIKRGEGSDTAVASQLGMEVDANAKAIEGSTGTVRLYDDGIDELFPIVTELFRIDGHEELRGLWEALNSAILGRDLPSDEA